MLSHASLWKTIYFTAVSATAQLLCLDWMQLKPLTDSLLLSCLSLKLDQRNKVSWYNWIHKFNEEHSWQQHVCKGCESQSNCRLTSCPQSRDFSISTKRENQDEERGRELKMKMHWVARGGREECIGSKRGVQVRNYMVIISNLDSEPAKSLICPR